MKLYSYVVFLIGFFHIASFQGLSMLYHVSEFHPFSLLNNIPFYDYTTFYLFLHHEQTF